MILDDVDASLLREFFELPMVLQKMNLSPFWTILTKMNKLTKINSKPEIHRHHALEICGLRLT